MRNLSHFYFYFFVSFCFPFPYLLPTLYGTFLADTINFCHLLFLLLFDHVTGNLKEYVEEELNPLTASRPQLKNEINQLSVNVMQIEPTHSAATAAAVQLFPTSPIIKGWSLKGG